MLGARIRRERKKLGMSQHELGERLGVSVTAVSKWENGLSRPEQSKLPVLAGLFGISIDELLMGEAAAEEDAPGLQSISVMTRAFRRMTAEEREQLLAISRTLYAHAFRDDEQKT